MAKIKYYDLTRLKKPAFLEYSEGFILLAGSCQTVTNGMQRKYAPLKAAYDAMIDISNRVDKSDLTDPIHLLDAQQDGIYTAIWHATNSLRKSKGEEGERATSLWNSLNSRRVHINIQYLQELNEVDRLIDILDRDQTENIEALGLLPLYTQLKAINAEIHRLIQERNDEKFDKPDGKFAAARTDYTKKYDTFVDFVNAYHLVNVEDAEQPDESLDTFIRQSNILIKLYEDTQRPSSSGSTTDKEEVEEEVEEEVTETEKPDDKPENKPEAGDENDENNENTENNGSNNGNNTGNENNGNQQEEDDPNMPPPGSGGSGFE